MGVFNKLVINNFSEVLYYLQSTNIEYLKKNILSKN